MSSFAITVNSDDKYVQKLVEFLASNLPEDQSKALIAEFEPFFSSFKAAEVLTKFLPHLNSVYNLDNITDFVIESWIQGVFSLMYTLTVDSQETIELVKAIISAIASGSSNIKWRLNSFLILFNMIISVENKALVLSELFKFASDNNQSNTVSPFAAKVEDWVAEWKISPALTRELLLNVYNALKQTNQAALTLRILIKYIITFRGEQQLSASAESMMKTALINAISSSIEAFKDRLSLFEAFKGIQAVSPDISILLSVLKIIIEGDINAFNNLKATQPQTVALLKELNLDLDSIEHNLKIMKIASLAALRSPLPFQDISDALSVPKDEVEIWVIEAISAGVIVGNIDQLTETVSISSYFHHSFGLEQWKKLQLSFLNLQSQMSVILGEINKANTVNPNN